MRLGILVGTRPELIKLAPVIRHAKAQGHKAYVLFTGQHREILKPFLKLFGIQVSLDLNLMKPGQSLTELSGRLLLSLHQNRSKILKKIDCLVVQGDTTSAWIAAYWASLERIPVAHVEAGLRTFDKSAPFPEEINRQLIGRIADFHFAPTPTAKENLLQEGIPPQSIHVVGNTSIDSLTWVRDRLPALLKTQEHKLSREILKFTQSGDLVLMTAHRRESFGTEFKNLCRGVLKITRKNPRARVLYPVHPNPNVRKVVYSLLGKSKQILLTDPLGYVPFIALMNQAKVLLTDSGGIQEEGPSFHKPILVLRNSTERPEGVNAGFAKLCGTNPNKIEKHVTAALKHGLKTKRQNPYGDGKSAERILRILRGSLR